MGYTDHDKHDFLTVVDLNKNRLKLLLKVNVVIQGQTLLIFKIY